MDVYYYIHESSQAPSPIKSQTPLHSTGNSFPIIVIAIIGILATSFLLVGYYIFAIKCWHRIDLSRRRRNDDVSLMIYTPTIQNRRGLDESVIRSIPIFQFKKGPSVKDFREGCAVCLNEFKEEEKLRIIPNCTHVFHIDCIDVWLQNNTNCPLCRSSIPNRFNPHQLAASSSSPDDLNQFMGSDELQEENSNDHQLLLSMQEWLDSGELCSSDLEQRGVTRNFKHVWSMGDECIDIRGKDDQFSIQPIRRSFSMDSWNHKQLCLAIQQNMNVHHVESCSSRVRRSFFSFGHGRGSRNAVLPIPFDP